MSAGVKSKGSILARLVAIAHIYFAVVSGLTYKRGERVNYALSGLLAWC